MRCVRIQQALQSAAFVGESGVEEGRQAQPAEGAVGGRRLDFKAVTHGAAANHRHQASNINCMQGDAPTHRRRLELLQIHGVLPVKPQATRKQDQDLLPRKDTELIDKARVALDQGPLQMDALRVCHQRGGRKGHRRSDAGEFREIRHFLIDSRRGKFDKGRNSIAPPLMEHLVNHVEQASLVGGEGKPLQRNLHAGLEIGLDEALDGAMGVFALWRSNAAGDIDPGRVARRSFDGRGLGWFRWL